jgi:hypothetical protein
MTSPGRWPLAPGHWPLLLRGSILLIAMLGLWWLALVNPLLAVLHSATEIPLALATGPGSEIRQDPVEWDFKIPVGRRLIQFSIPRSDVILFTFGLPVYWALALASRSGSRALLWGTVIVQAVEILCLILFVELIAHSIGSQQDSSYDPVTRWFTEFSNYLLVNVVPFLAPVVAAVSLDGKLRSQIFSR